jgi:hypothetical protein
MYNFGAFGCEPRRMLIINLRFGKYFSCHLQGEFVVGEFWNPYIGQAGGGYLPTVYKIAKKTFKKYVYSKLE